MVYVFLGDGFEEVEAITPVDILRRCGVKVETVSVMDGLVVNGAHGIPVKADKLINEITDNCEMYVLPGGTIGVENLSKSNKLCRILQTTSSTIAAICAAPTLLSKLGILKNKKAICYPSLANELVCGEVIDANVVLDKGLITSKGPGTSFDFGFAIAAALVSKDVVEKVRIGMLSE